MREYDPHAGTTTHATKAAREKTPAKAATR
jgi:hypothetical protein